MRKEQHGVANRCTSFAYSAFARFKAEISPSSLKSARSFSKDAFGLEVSPSEDINEAGVIPGYPWQPAARLNAPISPYSAAGQCGANNLSEEDHNLGVMPKRRGEVRDEYRIAGSEFEFANPG